MKENDIRWKQRFQNQIINNGDAWMDMIKTRNKAVHTYDESMVDDIIRKIDKVYYALFVDYDLEMQKISNEQ